MCMYFHCMFHWLVVWVREADQGIKAIPPDAKYSNFGSVQEGFSTVLCKPQYLFAQKALKMEQGTWRQIKTQSLRRQKWLWMKAGG